MPLHTAAVRRWARVVMKLFQLFFVSSLTMLVFASPALGLVEQEDGTCVDERRPKVVWHLPVGCSFSGFFVEFLGYLVGGLDSYFDLSLRMGWCEDQFLDRLTKKEKALLGSLQEKPRWRSPEVVIEQFISPCEFQSANDEETSRWRHPSVLKIGRTMSESALLTAAQTLSCQRFPGYLWVPSQFHYDRFIEQGISQEKLVVIPEAVDTDFFKRQQPPPTGTFVFFASSKWEHRKGWDVLLRAYFSEFSSKDDVSLRIQSYVPSWSSLDKNVSRHVLHFGQTVFKAKYARNDLPHYTCLDGDSFTREEQRRFYQEVHAFVLATRGEGWGLTAIEAMSMSLPVIVTNFSGPTAYLRSSHSYPLSWDMLDASGFAEPSVMDLRRLMRHVVKNRDEAKIIGMAARKFVVEHYDSRRVAQLIHDEVRRALSEDSSLNSR